MNKGLSVYTRLIKVVLNERWSRARVNTHAFIEKTQPIFASLSKHPQYVIVIQFAIPTMWSHYEIHQHLVTVKFCDFLKEIFSLILFSHDREVSLNNTI